MVGPVVAAIAIAAGARISFSLPGSPVPVTLQTFSVVLAGVLLGPLRAGVAVALYLTLGALGLPVWAGDGAGWKPLVGPTAGYLVGFLPAVLVVGWWRHVGLCRNLLPAVGGAAIAHTLVLALGWVRLGMAVGWGRAWTVGVLPFLPGGAVKSLLAGVLAAWWIGRGATAGRSGRHGRPVGSRAPWWGI